MKQKNSGLFLGDLLEELSNCKDLDCAKSILFSFCTTSDKVKEAVEFCIKAHDGQTRKSGEPYAVHPILVSTIVAYMGGEESMVLSALLHDVIEDTCCEFEQIKAKFGLEVANLVEGLTKIVEIRDDQLIDANSNERMARSALSFRKMLLVSIQDVRVLVIKLCDRLHNMSTIDALAPEKQIRISEETLMVYAPIAHRLGISSIKNLLEDMSFKHVLPNEYAKIDGFINKFKQQLQLKLNSFSDGLSEILLKNGFGENDFMIEKRLKRYYSIYLKMQRKGISIEEVLDLLAVRILVNEPKDCYLALGCLHTNFSPLISRFKDYIALPKQNGYQTIHTTLFVDKAIIEAQIRTFDMHKTAEYGVAAHWKYKDGDKLPKPHLEWLGDISTTNQEDENPEELYEYAKDSLYVEDINVLSPKGEIITLPRGATALDFAYEIHSEVGLHAKEAYINKSRVPLLAELKNGDFVKIVTDETPRYRCSWLNNVKTGKAKAAIRGFCKQKIKDINNFVAINILCATFNTKKRNILRWIENENLGKKVFKVASDSVFFQDVVNALKKYPRQNMTFSLNFGNKYEIKKQKFDNIVVYSNYKINDVEFDYCCNPKRGDDIIGFRNSHSVIVHHKLCERAAKLMQSGKEMIFVKWTRNAPLRYKIIASLENKRGSLASFLTFLVKMQVDLVTITLKESYDKQADFFELTIEVNENMDVNDIRDKIKDRYKIVEFISLKDAYSE